MKLHFLTIEYTFYTFFHSSLVTAHWQALMTTFVLLLRFPSS